MVALVAALAWCGAIGFAATASRMTWSFARDRGLPFYKVISKVSSTFRAKFSVLNMGHNFVFSSFVIGST